MCSFADENEIVVPEKLVDTSKPETVAYSIAADTLLIVDANMPWVAEYSRCFEQVKKLAEENSCKTIAITFERPATEYFLKKKGWETVTSNIMELRLVSE